MNRSLIVVIPGLPERHMTRIRNAAEKYGFVCRFFQNPEESLPDLENAEIIVGSNPILARHAPNLSWFCSYFAGVDPFMAHDAFANPSALLTNSSGAYGVTIAEHVLMVLLEILRRQPEYRTHIEKREWVRGLPVRAIFGSRITLLGTGDIGQETLRRLRGFAPKEIIGVNRSGKNPNDLFDRIFPRERLDDILPETDILIISLPGTPNTFHMIAERQLKLLPDEAILINVGRGAVIDQTALEAELRGGRLYAGLDVFEAEPIPQQSTLWSAPRLIITPHVAGETTLPHTMERIIDLFLEDLDNYCSGRPLARLVDRTNGY